MDISTLARDERDEFVAFLAGLAPEQWDVTSLCTEWTVKQLALHYLSLGETGPGGLLRALVAAGFSLDGAVSRLVSARDQRSTGELVQRLRAADPFGVVPLVGARRPAAGDLHPPPGRASAPGCRHPRCPA